MPRKNPAAVTLGRKGGKVTSEAKAAAARENGKKGGAPKKVKSLIGEENELQRAVNRRDSDWIDSQQLERRFARS